MRIHFNALAFGLGLLATAALVPACAPPAPAQSAGSAGLAPVRTITVVGEGEAKAKPDIARMNLGIEASGPSVAAALNQANGQMTAILAAVKQAGVAEKDIRTSNFSIHFERPYPNVPMPMPMALPMPAPDAAPAPAPAPRGTTKAGTKGASAGAATSGATSAGAAPGAAAAMPMMAPPQPQGVYRVSNMVEVTVRDIGKAGSVLESAVNAGANNVWNVTFTLDETKGAEAQAREKAVADARARAEELARLNGLRLGSIVSVSTLIGATPGPMGVPMPMMAAQRGDAGAPPLEAGELTWTTQVQVVFEFAAPGKPEE
jgi:hypothetical protein